MRLLEKFSICAGVLARPRGRERRLGNSSHTRRVSLKHQNIYMSLMCCELLSQNFAGLLENVDIDEHVFLKQILRKSTVFW